MRSRGAPRAVRGGGRTALQLNPDALVRLVVAVAIALLALCLLLMVLVGVARTRRHARERRRARVGAAWKPLILAGLAGAVEAPPRIAERDEVTVLYLWNYYRESLRGDSSAGLNELARNAGLDRLALRLLRSRKVPRQLLAAATLGHLARREAWEDLRRLAEGSNGFVALAAARALVDIDPFEAIPVLVPLLSRRTDWSPSKVAMILDEADPDTLKEVLIDAALESDPEGAEGLVRYLGASERGMALPVVRAILAMEERPGALAACLEALAHFRDPGDLEAVRDHLGHPEPAVRAEAAATLGAIGAAADEELLAELLTDPDWWVRYRAAEALASLSGGSLRRIEELRRGHADPRVREVLDIVAAERRVGLRPPPAAEGASAGAVADGTPGAAP